MSKSFKEEYDSKLNNLDGFKDSIKTYLSVSVNRDKPHSYIHLLSAVFEPMVLHGYSVTGVDNSGSVCKLLDTRSDLFSYVEDSRSYYQQLRESRNSIVHLNDNYAEEFGILLSETYNMSYPIFQQCMGDLLQDFKSLYNLEDIYLKLGGNKDTIPNDDLTLDV